MNLVIQYDINLVHFVITPFQAGKNSSKNLISLMNPIDSLLFLFRKNYTALELMSICLTIPFTNKVPELEGI